MCVRTKTSYGCGHEYKTTNDCRSSRCTGVEKYHYPREGDCKECKRGGAEVTRGREGKGRYAQAIGRRTQERDKSREPLAEISHNIETLTLDVGGGISPWGPPLYKEKDWGSPSRAKADRAWLEEHGERNVDLQTIRESMSSTMSSSDEASTAIYSPTRHDRPVHDHDDDRRYHEYDDDHDRRRHMDTTERNLQIEIRSINDDYERRSRRPTHHRQRHDSQESFQSTHSSRSSSHRYKPAPTTYTTYDYYETRDSAYGSLGSRGSNGYEVAKTEPYMYSPQPHVLKLKAPSTTSHGVYHTGFGVGTGGGAVDIVTRTPLYTYSHRRY